MSELITPTVPVIYHDPPDGVGSFVVYSQPGVTLNASGFVCNVCATAITLPEAQRPHPRDGYYTCPTCGYIHCWLRGVYFGCYNGSDRELLAMDTEVFPPNTGAAIENTDFVWTDHDAYGWTEDERHANSESFYPMAQIIPVGGYSRGIGPDWDETTNAYEGLLQAVFVGGVAGPAWQKEVTP